MNRARPGTLAARGLALLIAGGALALASIDRASPALQPSRGEVRPNADGAGARRSEALGETTVVAQNASGVPVHPEPRSPKIDARLPDGARVEVLEQRFEGQWLRVRTASGLRGWIARRYAPRALRVTRTAPTSAKADRAFLSPEQCRSALQTSRDSPRRRETARVGSYNLRWFPDGRPGRISDGRATKDLDWLACVIASLDVDVLAVQEIKASPRTREVTRQLMARLDLLTGGRWRSELDDCPDSTELHVGFFYDSVRVEAGHWQTLGELNPLDSACAQQLRPGLAGYFTFKGGLDLYIVSVHFKSTRTERSLALRARSLARLPAALARLKADLHDDDVLVVGDFNTMGCDQDCTPRVSPEQELARLSDAVAGPNHRLRLVPSDSDCTQYYRGRATRLDLFVAADTMQELLPASTVHVRGVCVELGCRRVKAQQMPLAFKRLSDHCPAVLDLLDRDLD
jgi:endonuclease/exonuclease/phosphatase family metal-dependent hydrolase